MNVSRQHFRRVLRSTRGLTLPVTYLILFASLITLISATYSFAVVKIGERADTLRAIVAKQNMLLLNAAVQEVAWSHGASKTVYMDDCGGTFEIEVNSRLLSVNVSDEQNFTVAIFRNYIGRVLYQYDAQGLIYENGFLKGDQEPIENSSSSTMTQFYVDSLDSRQLILAYRPSVSVAVTGTVNGKPLNLIRIYIISLNLSQSLVLSEKFHLAVTSANVSRDSDQWEFNNSIASLRVKASIDQTSGEVEVPIVSSADGAVVKVEVVLCSIKIQRPEV